MAEAQVPRGTPRVSGKNPKNSGGSIDTGPNSSIGQTRGTPRVAGGNTKRGGGSVGSVEVETYTSRSSGKVASPRSTSASRVRKVQ